MSNGETLDSADLETVRDALYDAIARIEDGGRSRGRLDAYQDLLARLTASALSGGQ